MSEGLAVMLSFYFGKVRLNIVYDIQSTIRVCINWALESRLTGKLV